eukprot:scaffold264530_cov19-Tisochrysis_lutea.AAC.3
MLPRVSRPREGPGGDKLLAFMEPLPKAMRPPLALALFAALQVLVRLTPAPLPLLRCDEEVHRGEDDGSG